MIEYRRHTKSRNGCTYCKQKKIKCDEVYPSCFHCRRRNITCSLASRRPRPPSTVVGSTRRVLEADPPGDPVDQANIVWHGNLVKLQELLSLGQCTGPASSPTTPAALCAHDVELMHHFCTVTVETMSPRLDLRQVWRMAIPQIGYTNAYVMHGLLAISATHKASLVPSQIHTYAAISEHHQALGSEDFRPVVAHTNKDNWRPIFSFSMIVALHLLALPSRSKNLHLETPIRSFVDLLSAVRGISSCNGCFQGLIIGSELEPVVIGNQVLSDDLPNTIPPLDHSILPADTFHALQLLREFVAANTVSKTDARQYSYAVDALERLTKRVALNYVVAEPSSLISWSWLIDDSILRDMRSTQPLALLLIAYFSGILASFETTYWFVRGWAKSLVRETTEHLSSLPAYASLMCWPADQVVHAWG